MIIVISNRSDQPIFEQIKNQIRTQIIQGDLVEGMMLPSIRNLANELKISVITTKRAYDDLHAEGFISSAAGKGFFVLASNTDRIKDLKQKEIEQNLMEAINAARLIGLTDEELKEVLDVLLNEL